MLPLVLVPGLQGRWEYMRRTVDALSQYFDVVTFSLKGETIEDYTRQLSRALDERHIDRAVICGVSFGGLVALHFAATCQNRTIALVLASTPGPEWHLKRRHQLYARLPWLCGPLFMVETPWRLREELSAALPDRRARWRFQLEAMRTLLTAPLPIGAMADRALLIERLDRRSDCDRVTAPTLVLTGEPDLDHVVSATASSDYVSRIRGARRAILERSGHIGSMTRADAFATLVHDFVVEVDQHAGAGRTHGSAPTGDGVGADRRVGPGRVA